MLKTICANFTLLLLLHFFADAQKASFEFFTTADGLTGNNTNYVTQDDQGFIWLINNGKIHRFDGRNWLVYPVAPELLAQEPFLGLATWQDSLLFVWNEHFQALVNPKTGGWHSVKLNGNIQPHEPINFWQKLGRQENLVLGSSKKGFEEAGFWHLRDNQLESVSLPMRVSERYYYWCDIDASGRTFLAYRDTLFQLDKSGKILATTPFNNVCKNCYNICFRFEPDGTLILLANWQFYRLDKDKNRFVPHRANRFLKAGQNHLHRFLLEKNGSLWACGDDQNLIFYDAQNDTLYNFHEELKRLYPFSNDFKGLFRDKTGIFWIDTRLGLLKVRPQIYPFDTYFHGLNQSGANYSFRGFTEDARGVIFGVFYDGVASFDPAKKQVQRTYTSHMPSLFDLSAAGDLIWVNGGRYLDPYSGKLTDVPSPFFNRPVGDNGFFARDKSGTLWWAAHYSLFYLENSEKKPQWVTALELPEKTLNKTDALHAGVKSEKLWISFKGKLLQYDPKTKEQRWFGPKDLGAAVSRIMAIEEMPDGKLWLGTDIGLVHFDPATAAARCYTLIDGLPNNFICGLLTEGDSCLWLSTNHGLSRFHIPTNTFINFFEEDGLTHNEFNRKSYFKARDGRMVFGGMKGVNAFYPEAVMQNYRAKEKSAHVVLTSLEYTDERRDTILKRFQFPKKPEIHFHHWDWSYNFEYVLTDYENPKEILYSYKVEGYKDGWSAPSKYNFARFNSLPAGEYIFRVRARDNHGHWHPNELALKVVVHPPWWATWWAYLAYFLLLSGLAYLVFSFSKKRWQLKNQLKSEQEEAQRLKELDNFKSRLYTNLTHEFRTPLTVILGMAGQIRSEPKKYLDEGTRLIETNGKNLLRLINQLLDLSKLENKSFKLHLQRGDIVPYLRYVTESFQTYANHKNLSLRFFTTLESLEMDYDPEQIKQVLTNLISNAVKFTPSGGEVKVSVSSPQSSVRSPQVGLPSEDCLLLTVKDTGIGIAEKDLPHIFDRFYQVDGSYTREGEGTGIGLAHTQELVKVMGGAISVESEISKGSTFLVRLPVTKNAPISDRATLGQPAPPLGEETGLLNFESLVNLSENHPESNATTSPITNPQLLIIEDNPDVVVYLKTCLEGQYRLDVAYNGKIGIEKALENIPDLIVSDVMMPEKDGYQVCDTLKNDERTSHIPIILLTAKADASSKITGLRRGADAYLTKPFDKEEMLVRLEMLVERQKRMVAHFSKNLLSENVQGETEEAIRVEDTFIQKVRQIVEAHYGDENFALPQLCQKIGMSRSQLFRKMQALSGASPSDFIRTYRLNKARTLLETTDLSVSEVAWQVGYKDLSHFSRSFQEAFGFVPSATGK